MDWLIPVLVTLCAIALNQAGLLRVFDGMVFDFITTHEAPSPPRVVIIDPDTAFERRGDMRYNELARSALALGVKKVVFLAPPPIPEFAAGLPGNRIIVGHRAGRIAGRKEWQLMAPASADAVAIQAASLMAVPEYGIFRRQLAGLKGADKRIPALETAAVDGNPDALPYYVRMPREQNVPRVAASQILDGDIAAAEVKDLIALISPNSDCLGSSRSYTTPLDPDGRAMPEEEFRALAIQTLADGRPVRPMHLWQTILIVLGLCLAAMAFYRRFDPKRIIIPATAAIMIVVVAAVYLALQLADILLPATALIFSQGLLAALIVHRRETIQDRHLSRQVDKALSTAYKQGAFDNQARLPVFLLEAATMLEVRHMLLLEQRSNGELVQLGSIQAALTDLDDDGRKRNRFFHAARQSLRTGDAAGLVPGWEGPVWIAWLGGAERDIYWLYSFAGTKKQRRGERLAAAMIGSYRELQRLRASLNAGSGRRQSFQSIDGKVTGALDLIAGHEEQIRNGLDALDTSVMIFHLLGYPLHANAAMTRLFEEAGLSLADTTLQEAITHLSSLEPDRIAKMLHELLFRGGELRLPCRPLGAKAVVLRIAAPFRVARGSERVVVLEAIDITNLKRLADLRLSVSNFIDSQLRNDLEAIALGASIAGKSMGAADRVIGLIGQAAQRAMNSLEEVAVHINNPTDDVLGLAYPVDAGEIARRAVAKAQGFADDLQVSIKIQAPEIGGYTIAEPVALEAMLEAMLLIAIAETQPGDAVEIKIGEEREHTRIHILGGFGVSFDSLCAALDAPDAGAPPEYRAISSGISQALGWKAKISYWSEIGKGYRFNIELRRIA
ncbi:MAG: hypothetical protein ACRCY3_08825 [Sphingorhabdus sp.]